MVLILDNGGGTIKSGFSTKASNPLTSTNAVVRSRPFKKVYFGPQFDVDCDDYSSCTFRRPFERGFCVDWDAQKAVWDQLFEHMKIKDIEEETVLITEPPFNLPNLQETYDQMFFEEYAVKGALRTTVAPLIPYSTSLFSHGIPEVFLLVDSGFSFTHVLPVIRGTVAWHAVRRLDVGGKLLTNALKERISYSQWNVMDETAVVERVKTACCFVSDNLPRDVEACRKGTAFQLEYILPNFTNHAHGFVRTLGSGPAAEGDQILRLSNDRFLVPEILFNPSTVLPGFPTAGLSDAIAQSIEALSDPVYRGLCWSNVVLVGGTCRLPGFVERLTTELRSRASTEYVLNVTLAPDPILESFHCAKLFVRSGNFKDSVLTRAEYAEGGSNAARRKFRGAWNAPDGFKETKHHTTQGFRPSVEVQDNRMTTKSNLSRRRSVK